MDTVPIPTLNRKSIGTPSGIAVERDYFAVMGPGWFPGMSPQEQVILLHDPVNMFVIHRGLPQLTKSTIQQNSDATVAVSGPSCGHLLNYRE